MALGNLFLVLQLYKYLRTLNLHFNTGFSGGLVWGWSTIPNGDSGLGVKKCHLKVALTYQSNNWMQLDVNDALGKLGVPGVPTALALILSPWDRPSPSAQMA